MATKSKKSNRVEYVVVGSNFQATEKEAGSGRTRNGIKLEMAMNLYEKFVVFAIAPKNLDEVEVKLASMMAESAFTLTEIFLKEMDKQMQPVVGKPLPPVQTTRNNN